MRIFPALPRISTALLLLAIITAGVRAAWITSSTPDGWNAMASLVRAGLPPFVRGDFDVNGEEQCEAVTQELLANANRTLHQSPASANDLIGAAVLVGDFAHSAAAVDRPLAIFSYALWQQQAPPVKNPNYTTIPATQAERCRTAARELLAAATGAEPTNVHAWRLRALYDTTYRESGMLAGEGPLPESLDLGPLHDPDEALYDYLAALHWLDRSWQYSRDNTVLHRRVIIDVDAYAQAIQRFNAGLEKSAFRFGEPGRAFAASWIERCTGATGTKMRWMRVTRAYSLPADIHFDLCFACQSLGEERGEIGDGLGEWNLRKLPFVWSRQYVKGEEWVAPGTNFSQFIVPLCFDVLDVVNRFLWVEKYVEVEPIQALAGRYSYTRQLAKQASATIGPLFSRPRTADGKNAYTWEFAAVTSLALAIFLMAVGLALWLTGRGSKPRGAEAIAGLGFFDASVGFVLLAGYTFARFGIAPVLEPQSRAIDWAV